MAIATTKQIQVQIKFNGDVLIKDFIRDCRLRELSEESIRGYKSNLLIFNKFLHRQRISFLKVDKEVLKEFLRYLRENRKVSQKRIENYFSSLSSFYEYLAYEGSMQSNPVIRVRKRYLRSYKKGDKSDAKRKLIGIEEMGMLINSILDARDKAIVTLLAKTGIRRGELIRTDLEDINWQEQSITLKPARKRSNRVVFFDDECARILKRWMSIREKLGAKSKALFPGENKDRICRNAVYDAVAKWAAKLGLHNPESKRMEDHFSPHCCRHWFTTWLRRNGMSREFIKELRGDKRKDAIDIYDHIDREELRKAYLAFIPQLGI